MANVAIGRRLLKGRERSNITKALKYLRLCREQEIRDNTRLVGGFTNTPAVVINTTTNSVLTSYEALVARLAKSLGWIAKGHGVPNPDTNGDLP